MENPMEVLTTDTGRLAVQVMDRCGELARFSEDAVSLRRTFLSEPMRDVHRTIAGWVKPLGATVRIDAAGNFRALFPGDAQELPRVLIGSHLDTVPNAGRYDGILGVVTAISLVEALQGAALPFAIEVVGFSEEEGVRFGAPFIGSRALIGRLDDSLLGRCDRLGVTVRQAIEAFGLDPREIPEAEITNRTFAYLEFHIEQGPVLERVGRPLGVVEAIVGQSRMEFTFIGRSNHAGTTPMDLRKDALAGAAEWITAVERVARTTPGLVATVGFVSAKPGAVNVIAGEVITSLDVRHRDDNVRTRIVREFVGLAEQIASRRSLSVRSVTHLHQGAVPMDGFLVSQIEEACRETGCEPHRMVSGAGHDAMILAERVPAAMIFLRTPGGISHDPAESVLTGDIAKAIECGTHLLRRLALSPNFCARTHRE